MKHINYNTHSKKFYKDGQRTKTAYLLTEEKNGYDLFEYVSLTGRLEVPETKFLMIHLLNGLEFIHE